jgi:hypothetical protein
VRTLTPSLNACQFSVGILSNISRILLESETHGTADGSGPLAGSAEYCDGLIVIDVVSVGGVGSMTVELW